MNMRVISVVVFVCIAVFVFLIALGHYYDSSVKDKPIEVVSVQPVVDTPDIKIESVQFQGLVSGITKDCESGGDCYMVVDGKRVVIAGADDQPWGQLRNGLNLQTYAGQMVEVYAALLPDNTYSIHGSIDYYVEIKKPVHAATVSLDESGVLNGLEIVPVELIEDSRCPSDVNCIQAGTVRVRTVIANGTELEERTFVLGKPELVLGTQLVLESVMPGKVSTTSIDKAEYIFTYRSL